VSRAFRYVFYFIILFLTILTSLWRRDLNVELINPFTRNIAHTWSKVFESDLFAPFRTSTVDVINTLIKEVEETAAPGLTKAAESIGETLDEAMGKLAQKVCLFKIYTQF
jgi:H2-forming N5,N10-methylenetetrahydromethanopterin dehydrogenase-like enzyme